MQRAISTPKTNGAFVESLSLYAPAKINYRLDVIRRRPDGYHDLRMVMQPVALCDAISISLTDTPGISVTCCGGAAPDGPDNIAWKAARALLDLAGDSRGAAIDITKHIPVAAGLGGGSSDAASVLMGMNDLLKLGLPAQRLMEIGVRLGADVPFFIFGKTALAEGIGEKLSAMPDMPPLWVVLVNPGIPVSTAWVYRNLQLTNREPLTMLPACYRSIDDICSILSNDLESVTIPAFPVIQEIKDIMMREGASGAMMSGSGPTVFGLFGDRGGAERVRDLFATRNGWFTAAVQTIS
jgi:4-diphosphocytidyl-2-C-methyl-D-erythritol kinase